MLFIILLNIGVTWLFFKSEQKEKYLFHPYTVSGGQNLSGWVLSHFAHNSPGHLIFNMLSLSFFAPVITEQAGMFQMLGIYLLTALGADLLVFQLRKNDADYRCLGASGSVIGIIFASIVYHPQMNIFLFFLPIPIPAPLFAIGYVVLSVYMMKKEDGISHEAHIGGAVSGFVLGALFSENGLSPLMQWANGF